jgi:hypothetical protein
MAARIESQNGYSVPASSKGLLNPPVGANGVKLAPGVRPDEAGKLLILLAEQFDKRVEKLVSPGCWGYNYRAVRGQTTGLSNHSSATAIDLNAPRHPLGKVNTFTPKQKAEIHKILDEFSVVVNGKKRPAIRWGGDYTRRKDEMHFEIICTWEVVMLTYAKVRKLYAPKPAPKPVVIKPAPKPVPKPDPKPTEPPKPVTPPVVVTADLQTALKQLFENDTRIENKLDTLISTTKTGA